MTHEYYRQKGLFEPDHHQTEINWEHIEPSVDEHVLNEDDTQQRENPELIGRAESEPEPFVGPHTPINVYYENTLEMIKEVCGANRGRYFVAKNTTSEGFAKTVEQYGGVSEALSVSMNTGRRAYRLQRRMDKLFQVDELMVAGFAAKAIQEASKKNTAELTALYTGTHNKETRTQKRKDIKKKLVAVNERISTDI